VALSDAFTQARAANGPIDILIVNAGIGDSAPFGRISRGAWDRMLAVNLSAPFDCVQKALPDLLASDAGRIVFIASVAGLRGTAYAAHYAASKHGLIGLMRSLAVEFARSNLTVNAICPGFVDTPMTDQSVARISERTGRSEEASRAAIESMNANGRLARPEGIAALALTLCLPGGRDINGAALTVDGGTTA
jgi:NAD(P)-dependent dehydrogenase (short-subunit alcohol dehydrogenase family)